MPEFKKIYCAYHEKQFITNFCLEAKCILPLCPHCVCSHNEFHHQDHTQATYSSIDNVLTHSFNSMVSLIKGFQEEHQRMSTIIPIISEMPNVLIQKLKLAQNMAITEIELAFSKLQRQMLTRLSQKQEQVAGPNCILIQESFNIISESLNNLNKKIKFLKGEKCLSSVIKFIQREHEQYTYIKNQISSRINKLECLEPCINIDEDILEHIDPLLRKFINLEFPESQCKESSKITQNTQVQKQPPQHLSTTQLKFRAPRVRAECQKLQEIVNTEIDEMITCRRQKNESVYQDELQNISKKIVKLRKNCQQMGGRISKF